MMAGGSWRLDEDHGQVMYGYSCRLKVAVPEDVIDGMDGWMHRLPKVRLPTYMVV